ncbi:hypothetical protein [Microtetraspora sp. NBRC 16547]|uniref:lipopolysaccharide biosynthesis protein n=1 Tax=Microtetraspora sp. NBRC 16547 TaxID=3030993 RepID=UPI00249FB9D3|nr:hypothetical protein [Microtetraspora sp. NBRC 16547]GLW99708.1 hypothetical protein Misp02_37950 [Microtetraspora sp. NBRC 16547]
MTETPAPAARLGERPLRAVLRERLSRDFNDPLYRSAYALLLNAGAGAVLGFGYWIVAAHVFEQRAVGHGLALITSMRLLASLTSFGFVGSLTRFIPETGRATSRFIAGIYIVGAAFTLTATVGFLLTLDVWGPTYRILSGWGPGLLFTAMVLVWSTWTLQDVVLTALRKSEWVPVENVILSVLKIVLLAAGAMTLKIATADSVSWTVYLAWIIPGIFAVVPVNYMIFRRLVPRHLVETGQRTPPSLGRIGRFLVGDYFGAFFRLAMVNVVPFIVATRVGAGTYASYGMAVTLAQMLEALAFTMATSLTVEGVFDASSLAVNARRALRRTLSTLLPVVLVLVVVAPHVLGMLGKDYQEATTVLRLIAVATIPRALIELYLGALRAQARSRPLLVIQALQCVITIAGVLVLLPVMGINGVGVSLLSCQLVVAAVIAPGLRALFNSTEETRRQASGSAASTPWWLRHTRALPAILTVEGVLLHVMAPEHARPLIRTAGLALVLVALLVSLAETRPHPLAVPFHLGAALFCLHPYARAIPEASALVEGIVGTGVGTAGSGVEPSALPAFLLRAGSLTAGQVLGWAPLACALLASPAVATLVRAMRVQAPGAVLFLAGAWGLQVFYPPLGLAYVLYLSFIALLTGRRSDPVITILLVVLPVVAASAHPLTALVMAATCAVLMPGWLRPGVLLAVTLPGTAAGVWGLARLGTPVASPPWAAAADGLAGPPAAAVTVLLATLALSAVWGAVRLVPAARRGRADRTPLVLVAVPTAVVAVTLPLAGAAAAHLALIPVFALPGACALASHAFSRDGASPRRALPRRPPSTARR